MDGGEMAAEVREVVNVQQQAFDPDQGQTGLNHFLSSSHSHRRRHGIVAFQLEFSLLNLGTRLAGEPVLGQGGRLMKLLGQDDWCLLRRRLVEGGTSGRPDLLPAEVIER
jgi:hypothetical protein